MAVARSARTLLPLRIRTICQHLSSDGHLCLAPRSSPPTRPTPGHVLQALRLSSHMCLHVPGIRWRPRIQPCPPSWRHQASVRIRWNLSSLRQAQGTHPMDLTPPRRRSDLISAARRCQLGHAASQRLDYAFDGELAQTHLAHSRSHSSAAMLDVHRRPSYTQAAPLDHRNTSPLASATPPSQIWCSISFMAGSWSSSPPESAPGRYVYAIATFH